MRVVVEIIRTYPGGKWVKAVLEDGSVEWIRAADVAAEE
jgi:hypothetical protein